MEINEYILETSGVTKDLDAASPSNIRYPQDFSLLNEVREKLAGMIDYFHKNCHPWAKPRTYRRVKLYEQQKYMYENKTHSVEDRIVSIN